MEQGYPLSFVLFNMVLELMLCWAAPVHQRRTLFVSPTTWHSTLDRLAFSDDVKVLEEIFNSGGNVKEVKTKVMLTSRNAYDIDFDDFSIEM